MVGCVLMIHFFRAKFTCTFFTFSFFERNIHVGTLFLPVIHFGRNLPFLGGIYVRPCKHIRCIKGDIYRISYVETPRYLYAKCWVRNICRLRKRFKETKLGHWRYEVLTRSPGILQVILYNSIIYNRRPQNRSTLLYIISCEYCASSS